MAKRKTKTLGFYKWEVIFRIEVASDICRKIFHLLEDALFKEFNTAAVLTRAYANENCAHFRIKVDPGDQEKLIKLISKFCREQKLVLLQDANQ